MSEKLLKELSAIPTAPFVEQRVIAWVLAWAKKRRKIKVSRDRFGNILLELAGKPAKPRTVMVAHMDHPGFIADQMIDRKTLQARFYGFVSAKFFVGSTVRFFNASSEVRGKITKVQTDPAGRPIGATLSVSGPVEAGAPGMWDQGGPRIVGKRFVCRVCDDIAGVASALATMDALLRVKLTNPVAVLLTRAEEQGFVGAIAAAIDGKLLRKTDRIISIECSAQQPYAQQGNGVIVRTGDYTSIFNSAYTRFLHQRAQAIAKSDKTFKYQRALMPGGTCEATVFDAWEYTAAAVCVPLGNYHNQNTTTGKIGPEYVDLRDWHQMVALLSDVSRNGHLFTGKHTELVEQLTKRFKAHEKLF
jgi:endoglucanase